MKITFTLTVLSALILSCSGESTNETDNAIASEITTTSSNAPTSDEDTQIEITFSSGTMKGTHVFKPDASNPMSQINVGYDDDISNLNASALVSEDGKHRLAIGRPFMGEATVGTHNAKEYTDNCGFFKLRALEGNTSYFIIRGNYQDCSKTEVTATGEWEEDMVYNRRGVVAKFSEMIELEISSEDGSTSVEVTEIQVIIKARESRLK